MHPPQGACIPVERDIALRHIRIQTPAEKLIAAEGPAEKAPVILDTLNFNNKNTRQFRFFESHRNRELIIHIHLGGSYAKAMLFR